MWSLSQISILIFCWGSLEQNSISIFCFRSLDPRISELDPDSHYFALTQPPRCVIFVHSNKIRKKPKIYLKWKIISNLHSTAFERLRIAWIGPDKETIFFRDVSVTNCMSRHYKKFRQNNCLFDVLCRECFVVFQN